MFDTLIISRGNPVYYDRCKALARSIVTDPAQFLLLSIAWASVQFGFTGPAFRAEPFVVNQVVLGGFLLLHLCAQYFWLPAWFYRGSAAGVPLLAIFLAFYTTAHIIFHLIFGYLVFDADFAVSWARFWRTYPVAVLITLAYGLTFLPRARVMLSAGTDPVPAHLADLAGAAISSAPAPQTSGSQTSGPQMPSPATTDQRAAYIDGVNGRVLQIRVDGKHSVIVTDQGQRIVRSALSDLVEALDESLGFRCHRSLWVAEDQIVSLTYLNGNPHVTLLDGSLHAISRAIVPKLRDHLAARKGILAPDGSPLPH